MKSWILWILEPGVDFLILRLNCCQQNRYLKEMTYQLRCFVVGILGLKAIQQVRFQIKFFFDSKLFFPNFYFFRSFWSSVQLILDLWAFINCKLQFSSGTFGRVLVSSLLRRVVSRSIKRIGGDDECRFLCRLKSYSECSPSRTLLCLCSFTLTFFSNKKHFLVIF